jgi:hypothetical protein
VSQSTVVTGTLDALGYSSLGGGGILLLELSPSPMHGGPLVVYGRASGKDGGGGHAGTGGGGMIKCRWGIDLDAIIVIGGRRIRPLDKTISNSGDTTD